MLSVPVEQKMQAEEAYRMAQRKAAEQMADSQTLLMESLEADKRDGVTARKRLAEAKRDPSKLVRGKALEDELARLES